MKLWTVVVCCSIVALLTEVVADISAASTAVMLFLLAKLNVSFDG